VSGKPLEPVHDLDSVECIGAGLRRPECVLCTADGVAHVSNWDGGISNRLIRIDPDGGQQTWLEDVDPEQLEIIEAAFVAEQLGRPHLDKVHSRKLRNISSMAFGGADLQDAYLGCLLDECIARIRLPLPGHPPAHWNF
jgi:hypothetical protein